jgi:hypothetical protein
MRLSKGSNLFEDTFRQTYWVYGVPVRQDQDENSQVVRFDIVLVYSISADAGDEIIILAERCSVMPLKCICCVTGEKGRLVANGVGSLRVAG